MTFKVNYGFQKAERDRAKQAKKDAKKREKEQAGQQPAQVPRDADQPGANQLGGEVPRDVAGDETAT